MSQANTSAEVKEKSINITPVSEIAQMSLVCITLVFPPKDPHKNIAKSNLRFLALDCRLLPLRYKTMAHHELDNTAVS